MQRDNSDTAQAVSFLFGGGHLYRAIGMDRYQPSSGVNTGLAKRRHYWARQAASLLASPSDVNTGPAKRDNAAVLMSVKRGVDAVFAVWLWQDVRLARFFCGFSPSFLQFFVAIMCI